MSLVRAVIAGTLVGAVAALGIFAATGPDDLGRAAVPATPTFAPVPTPTVTQLADCTPPAVLKKGFCVTTTPGPKVTATVRSTGSATSAPRTSPRTAPRPAPAPVVTDEPGEEPNDDGGDDEHDDD